MKARFDYFPSVDAFLQEHAQPIAHITVEWVRERLDSAHVHALVAAALGDRGHLGRHLRVWGDVWYGELEPVAVKEVTEAATPLDDVHVWDVADALADVFLEFEVQVTANVQCRATSPATWPRERSRGFYGEHRVYHTIPCYAAYRVSIAAAVRGATLRLGGVEHVAPQ